MEVLVLMSKSLRNSITINKVKIDSIDISTASSIRNLGVIFDSALSSEAFVNAICKFAWFNLFIMSTSRRSLKTDAAKILIQAFVMSKIDRCNSLLYGIPDKLLDHIQWIQNYAARVFLRQQYHTSTGYTTLVPCQSLSLLQDRIAGLQSPKRSSPSLYRISPTALWSTPKAARGWPSTPFTTTLLFEIILWLCVLLCSPSCME